MATVLGNFWVKDKTNCIACPSRLGNGRWVNVKIITEIRRNWLLRNRAQRQDEVRRVVVRSKTRRITLRNVLIYVNRVDPYHVHTSFVERAMKCLATADFCQRKDMIF